MTNKRSNDGMEESTEMRDKDQSMPDANYNELMQKAADAEQKANQYWDRLLRTQAEMENMVRRSERDVANAHKYALEKFVLELLPIIDSLELSLHNASEKKHQHADSLHEGVSLILKMFRNAMEKFGVKQVDPVSQPFNPEWHQAISMQPDASVPPGTVVSVLQKGYLLNNRLVRPALVVVSKANEGA